MKRHARWVLLSALCGILAGLAAAAFLIVLDWATLTRTLRPQLIWLLPFAGLGIGALYQGFGRNVGDGSNLILNEIHDPKKVLPVRMTPFIFLGTILTHLFGGSAGREGTVVQMGASLADQLSRVFKIEPEERKILLVAGAGAGFGAAIGAPWAGTIFGMEVVSVGRLRPFAWLECLIASFVSCRVTTLLGAHHSVFPKINAPGFDAKAAFFSAVAGIIFGLAAIVFMRSTHFYEGLLRRFRIYPPLKLFFAGIALALLFQLEGTHRFEGLGIPVIQQSFRMASGFSVPLLKSFFTTLTVGSGYKGGEFIPLVFIGTTLGSALSTLIPLSLPLLAALGFAALFAGASNTPLACSLMAVELFGAGIAPYALIACFASYYSTGHHGLYHAQRVHSSKHERLRFALSWLGELPKRFLAAAKQK